MSTRHATYQTSHFTVFSISYEKANAEVRGKFAFFEENTNTFVKHLHEKRVGDAFVVSTCNRTEIYTTAHNPEAVAEEYCETTGVSLEEFRKYANLKHGSKALNHLFRVAAGLESQIIGDFEIISQIKNAFNGFKRYKNYSNPYLERAINSAIQISKRIKNETGLSNGAASVSYASVHYILHSQKLLTEKNILLLGTGEIGQNTVENLVKHIFEPKVKIANRTPEKAQKISRKYNIPRIEFEDFKNELPNTDILIVATGAKKPILNKESFPPGKEMLVLDLSIPNNVAKDVAELPHITLVDVDELSLQIQETMEQRKKEVPKAEEIIDEMTHDFVEWEYKRQFAPNIHHFKASLKNIERNEMHNFYRKYKYVEIEDMELSNKLIQKITNRFARFIINNPDKAEEVSELMHEILVKQPNDEFNEKH